MLDVGLGELDGGRGASEHFDGLGGFDGCCEKGVWVHRWNKNKKDWRELVQLVC